MSDAIVLEGITVRHGSFAVVKDVTFKVAAGSLTALLGPSGSGKSTLLRTIAGFDHPESGTVTINGHDMTHIPPERRDVGFVFQHYAAFRHLTVRENIGFGLRIRKVPKAVIKSKVDTLLDVVRLTAFQDRYPAQLSGGQRQRMVLARALAIDPQVLLLDEPFGALDGNTREELRSWLRRLHHEMHVTTVLVTHDQNEALDVADRVAILNNGHIEQAGSPSDVYDRPANGFVMSFLSSVSAIGGVLVRSHDLRLSRSPVISTAADDPVAKSIGVITATVDRVVRLGFEVRVQLTNIADHSPFTACITRGDADALNLQEGDTVFVRATRVAEFDDPAPLSQQRPTL